MSTLFYVCGWAVLTLVVVALAIYRYSIVHRADATLNIAESAAVGAHQLAVFKRADVIERWGKALTVIVLFYGLALASAYVYQVWQLGAQMPK